MTLNAHMSLSSRMTVKGLMDWWIYGLMDLVDWCIKEWWSETLRSLQVWMVG